MDFFNSAHFAINVLTLPMALTGIATLGFGIWVLAVNRYDRLHRDFFVLCCVITCCLSEC